MKERKIDHFFSLVRGVYGASKFASQWPTDLDIQAAKKLWADEICAHTPEELSGAIKNAQHMAASGELDWQWPNIGLILSGARRYGSSSHRQYLPEPAREIPEKNERAEIMKRIRNEIGI